jgi:chromosome segregation ATPase
MSSFIDLRTNSNGDSGHGGFWPSFTDIMMVVVMIFMLASVVLILRNWELVQTLRNTMESERLAEEMARSVTETNSTLEEQLAQAQYQLSELRMNNMQLSEENTQQREGLAEKEQQLLQLGGQLRDSEGALQREVRQRTLLEEQLQKSQGDLALLNEQYAQQQQHLSNVTAQLSSLEESHRQQAEQLSRITTDKSVQTQQLTELQQEYDTLQVKYDKLIKPARTAKGKYVVEVRYEKRDGKEIIRFRDQDEEQARVVSSKAMHQQLAELKKAHPGKLYIKIIIPADSGLSYNEAWSFMKSLLEKYDYYYQS